ncbi:chemotaxis protein [Lactobacillus sp. UMNPBX9]|nr:chemotaxis protein [Lactobacillus sp. UMNPBX9]
MSELETKDIIKWWKFPSATIINRNLPKTQIYPHMKNVADKQFLQDSVQSIYMLASLKTDNTHIAVYEDDKELYQEIQFLYVKTKDKGDSTKIYKILAHLIPYPLVILTDGPDSFTIYTGRFEKLSTGFLKLVNVYPSPVYQDENLEEVLQQISLIDLPRQNLKTFYDGLRDEIATATAKSQYGEAVGNITGEEKDQLDALKKQIEDLRGQIKKERQLNRKIDMQMKLKKLKDELSSKINQ